MARRNAQRRPQKKASSKARKPLPSWLWFGAGLGCCLMGVFLYRLTTLPASPPDATQTKVSIANEKAPDEGLKFRFYDALRQFSVGEDTKEKSSIATPPQRSTAQTTADSRKTPPPKPKPASPQSKPEQQRYFLQAGSFKQREQAEKRRIELLLLNTDADITRVNHGDTPWYRVRTGPYHSYQQVDGIRDRLLDEGIDTLLTRR